jgi:AcrR family transcriptional regulator
MSNESVDPVRKVGEPDPRVARSTRALGRALIELIEEREYDEITVQSILDRAGVGRATFYSHYRNKDDVLYSAYERVFAAMEAQLDGDPISQAGPRLFPVREFAAHVSEVGPLMQGLRASGRHTELWQAGVGYAARLIERRLEVGDRLDGPQRQLVGRMLAGALMESVQWWLDHPAAATPAQLDVAFHRLARTFLQ